MAAARCCEGENRRSNLCGNSSSHCRSALVVLLSCRARATSPIRPRSALPLLESMEPAEACLMPAPERRRIRPRAGPAPAQAGTAASDAIPPGWPGKQALGGNVPATRTGLRSASDLQRHGVDPENSIVVFSDENRGAPASVRSERGGFDKGDDRAASATSRAPRSISGSSPASRSIPIRREIYTVNNDGGGLVVHCLRRRTAT